MALDFLNTVSGVAQKLPPIFQGISNIQQAFRKNPGQPDFATSPYEQAYQVAINEGPTAAEQRAGSLYEALLQPGNSLVSQLTNDNMQTGMNNFLMQLKQMQMMDARRQGRGLRGTFFNPERADETVSYLTSRGMPAIQQQAQVGARGQIMDSARAIGGQANLESQRRQRQLSAMQTNAALQAKTAGRAGMVTGGTTSKLQRTAQGLQGLTSGIQGLLGAFGMGQQQAPAANFIGPMPQSESIFGNWF